MKIAEINTVDFGSTGNIMLQIAARTLEIGEAYTFSRKWKGTKNKNGRHTYFGSFFENAMHHILAAFTGKLECFSSIGTNSLIRKLKNIDPDIIHLHNLHGFYINVPNFFKYIKKNNIKVIWTLHDCWAFTGHCPHFDMIGCEKWKTGCYSCPQYRDYPKTYVDRSKWMYKKKKQWFLGVEDLTIVTPSKWLANLAKQSFLKDYPVRVINNGIDLSVFKPTESDFKKKYDCEDKKLILGVAFGWGKRKGLDVFIELSKRLPKNYQIVLVGTDETVDRQLPKNIISIHRTQNQAELAEIYSAVDLFVNPTREENFPTVNIESLACGTPVLTFKTGGSPEIIDETCGVVVEKNNIDELYKEILRIVEEKPFSKENCLARSKKFERTEKFSEYIELYKERMQQ